jgi:hypothetical protein
VGPRILGVRRPRALVPCERPPEGIPCEQVFVSSASRQLEENGAHDG